MALVFWQQHGTNRGSDRRRTGSRQGEPLVEGDLVVNVATDLDAFCRDVLSYTEFEYQTPGFVYVEIGESVNTACGPAQTGFWGFFCPVDVTIYIDECLISRTRRRSRFRRSFRHRT